MSTPKRRGKLAVVKIFIFLTDLRWWPARLQRMFLAPVRGIETFFQLLLLVIRPPKMRNPSLQACCKTNETICEDHTLFTSSPEAPFTCAIIAITEGGCPTAQSLSKRCKNLYHSQLQIDLFQKNVCD